MEFCAWFWQWAALVSAAPPTPVLLYCRWGLSVPLSLMVITLYLGRLTMYNLPPKELVRGDHCS